MLQDVEAGRAPEIDALLGAVVELARLTETATPHLDTVLAAYDEAAPLADGWRARVPLHQLHPLLVHVALFGGSYRASLVDAARASLG